MSQNYIIEDICDYENNSDDQLGQVQQFLLQRQLPHLASPQLLPYLEYLLVKLLQLLQLLLLPFVPGVVHPSYLKVYLPQLLLQFLLSLLLLKDICILAVSLLLDLDLPVKIGPP